MTDLVPLEGEVLHRHPESVRDVDPGRWDEEPDARDLAVQIWPSSQKSAHARSAHSHGTEL